MLGTGSPTVVSEGSDASRWGWSVSSPARVRDRGPSCLGTLGCRGAWAQWNSNSSVTQGGAESLCRRRVAAEEAPGDLSGGAWVLLCWPRRRGTAGSSGPRAHAQEVAIRRVLPSDRGHTALKLPRQALVSC